MTNYSMTFTKHDVEPHEAYIHEKIYNMNIVNIPKIYSYDKDTKTLIMECIPELCISDMYGEKLSDIPGYIVADIRNIIRKLYDSNIEYTDITGYNFIEYDDRVWIIDFEHAQIKNKNMINEFISDFINGYDNWNPDFN
jgi:tRNA A-37 threonylcarbamoyl transferase component Bud32